MSEISRDELDRLYQTLDTGFRGIHERLDRMNGRVGHTETAIAVLQDRAGNVRDGTARWVAGLTGASVVLGELAHRLWGSK